ncbi:MAG: hypothetical protein GC129_00665 [Proteobacteria bacterium]|nr:hypothetical protein [Pseudomonadota bacterium]
MAAQIIYQQPNLGATVPDATKARLKGKAEDFESFYIYQFLDLVSPQNDKSVFGGGEGERMFRHQLNEEVAKNISHAGGFGLANKVYSELLRQQEAIQQRSAQ